MMSTREEQEDFLKPHQKELVKQCITLESMEREYGDDTFKSSIGILGDKVGSGKSFVIIELIRQMKLQPHGDSSNYSNTRSVGLNHIVIKSQRPFKVVNTSIIVIPHNLVCQWEKYLIMFGGLKYRIINTQRKVANTASIDEIHNYDIIVIAAPIFNQFSIHHSDVLFKRVFFDEADIMNIPNCAKIHCEFTWFVTASYNNLVYPKGHATWNATKQKYMVVSVGIKNRGYISNLFTDLYLKMSPEFIKCLVIKTEDGLDVNVAFDIHPPEAHVLTCSTNKPSQLYHSYNDDIMTSILANLDDDNNDAALQLLDASVKDTQDNIINKILENQGHPSEHLQDNIRNRIKDATVCNICLNSVCHQTIASHCCQNSFCFKCIVQWLNVKQVCPCCMKDLHLPSMAVVVSPSISRTHDHSNENNFALKELDFNKNKDKLGNFSVLVDKISKHGSKRKTLVFSAYQESFQQIAKVLEYRRLKYDILRGTGPQLKRIVNSYKSGPTDFLLLDASNFGCGLNLEDTSDIVFLHQFSEDVTNQVIGRAQRQGRKGKLNVWYFITNGDTHLS